MTQIIAFFKKVLMNWLQQYNDHYTTVFSVQEPQVLKDTLIYKFAESL